MDDAIAQGIEQAAKIITDAEVVVCVGHIAPDADALGSALALAAAARGAGKEAVASFGDPFVVPENFSFLPLDVLVPASEVPAEPDVMVAFDTAALERLGNLATNATNAATLIVIDHHASNEGFGDLDIIDPTAGAAGQLAYALIARLGWEVTPQVATALLAAIVADTGRFQYSSTTPELMRLGADLVDAGAKPTEVGQNLFEKVPFGYLQVMSAVAGRAELDPERSLVWSVVFHKDLKAGNITYEDSEGLIDNIRIANEAEVALLLREVETGFKGSLRSRGGIDVGAIAAGFGGGGHHNAAGFSHPGSLEDIVAAVRSQLDA